MTHLIGFWYTHDNLANMLAIFHIVVGVLDSLPGKNLTNSGRNDPLLREAEHFMAVVFEC